MTELRQSLSHLLGPAPLIVFDLDETLAETGLTSTFIPILARIYLDHGFYKTEAAATEAITADFLRTGCSVRDIGRKHGQTDAWVATIYQRVFQDHLPLALATLQPDPQLHQLLEAGKAMGCTYAVLTQSHDDDYAKPIIRHLGLSPWIPDAHILGVNASVINRSIYLKSVNNTYQRVFNALPGPYSSHWMFEDSPLNLFTAKACGFRTILVGNRTPTPQQARRIDHRHPTLTGFLQHLFGIQSTTLAA